MRFGSLTITLPRLQLKRIRSSNLAPSVLTEAATLVLWAILRQFNQKSAWIAAQESNGVPLTPAGSQRSIEQGPPSSQVKYRMNEWVGENG